MIIFGCIISTRLIFCLGVFTMGLKELRKKNSIPQKELAKLLSVKQSTVSMWETGKSTPPLNKIPLLARALNVSESEIIDCFKEQ